MKALVVDDSKLARLSLAKVLSSFITPENIFQAENGAIALDIAQETAIDLVFLDLTMPVMDGYEALPKLLQINPDLQVMVVSADIQPKAREKVLELGARMHVQKPISADKMNEIFGQL